MKNPFFNVFTHPSIYPSSVCPLHGAPGPPLLVLWSPTLSGGRGLQRRSLVCDFSGFPVTPGESHSVHVLYPLPRRWRQGKFPWMGEDEISPCRHRLMAPDGVGIPKVNLRAPMPTRWGCHYQEPGAFLGSSQLTFSFSEASLPQPAFVKYRA